MIAVKGICPIGCGETLFLGDNGYVTCSFINCPKPDAASELLENSTDDSQYKELYREIEFLYTRGILDERRLERTAAQFRQVRSHLRKNRYNFT